MKEVRNRLEAHHRASRVLERAIEMKTFRYLVFFVAGIALSVLGQTGLSFAGRQVALVIGNSAYEHTRALTDPRNDAADVQKALIAAGFDVNLRVDIDKAQFDQSIAQLGRDAKTADAAIFYYSGHSMQFEGKNFLMSVDTDLQDAASLGRETTALDDVKAALQLSPGIKIMVLDACRSNPLADEFAQSIGAVTREIPKVRGCAGQEKAQGIVVVYAAQADATARDGEGHGSPFSRAFVKEINVPGVEVGMLFRRIAKDVYVETNGEQSPEFSLSMVPEYYLNQSDTDQKAWERIRANPDLGALRVFLDASPDSPHAPDARALLDLLEHEAKMKDELTSEGRQRQEMKASLARLQENQEALDRAVAEANTPPPRSCRETRRHGGRAPKARAGVQQTSG